MSLTVEDKAVIREIVRDEIKQEVEPLKDMMDSFDSKQDAMMGLLAPLLYDRHRVLDVKMQVNKLEAEVRALQQQQVA